LFKTNIQTLSEARMAPTQADSREEIREMLERRVSSCHRCNFVDKPFLLHRVYSWLPRRVRVLAIGESPPPGKKVGSLYHLDSFDRLRLSLKLILGVEGEREVLETLKRSSVFLTAAVKCRPPNRESIEEMRRNCLPLLKGELEDLRPRVVVAMGKYASASLCELLGLEPPRDQRELTKVEADGREIFFTPHPNYLFRFGRNLAGEMRKILLGLRA
jgi:uracil-DNA glycosylase